MLTKYEKYSNLGNKTTVQLKQRDTWTRLSRSTDDPRESWKEAAACKDEPDWVFFPEAERPFGKSWYQAHTEVKRICGGCPVKQECHDYGQELGRELDQHFGNASKNLRGVWGGTSYTNSQKNGNQLV